MSFGADEPRVPDLPDDDPGGDPEQHEPEHHERDGDVDRADHRRTALSVHTWTVVGLATRSRPEVARGLHDRRFALGRERRADHEGIDEPAALLRLEVHVEQVLPDLLPVARVWREDELDGDLLPGAVLHRPRVKLPSCGRVRIHGDRPS